MGSAWNEIFLLVVLLLNFFFSGFPDFSVQWGKRSVTLGSSDSKRALTYWQHEQLSTRRVRTGGERQGRNGGCRLHSCKGHGGRLLWRLWGENSGTQSLCCRNERQTKAESTWKSAQSLWHGGKEEESEARAVPGSPCGGGESEVSGELGRGMERG